ncbi:MAG TPA: ribosome recycling factor [Alphaproteobacteria bacterium]|nr:ribosome recycling factor [Alphaproteobacteria bacterium]
MSTADPNELRRRMTGAFEVFKKEMSGLRTGRASVSLLEPIQVEAYGSHMPLSQLGTVNAPEPRMLTVQVWDKSMVKAVEKAIREANIGVNPMTEGQLLRVPIPPLTEERRKELVKLAHKFAEQARVSIRNVRRDGMEALKDLEKSHKINEDEHRKRNAETQKLTDEMIKKVDETLAAKEKDILNV